MNKISITPKTGRFLANIFENKTIGIPPTLFFYMYIPIEEMNYKGNKENTEIQLEFIDFKINNLSELENRLFKFPKNPENGYIDGSIYFGGAHNPADALSISFGNIKGNTITAKIELEIDFTFEGPEELGIIKNNHEIKLEINKEEINNLFIKAKNEGII